LDCKEKKLFGKMEITLLVDIWKQKQGMILYEIQEENVTDEKSAKEIPRE
jgi:hypothetical protein